MDSSVESAESVMTKTQIKHAYLQAVNQGGISKPAMAFWRAKQQLIDIGFPPEAASERVIHWHNERYLIGYCSGRPVYR